ncbi:hypothetical protein Tco_0955566 [Tanacetum coccineum]|uniref:Uncharacterized protein n=1 Tax=Tanacetum coccineum TaxID=301880 RepID=A0ABQ5E7L4_9ASTR
MQPEMAMRSILSENECQKPVQAARECTYPDFLKYQPLNSRARNLKVKGNDDGTPIGHRIQELALMCDQMFPEESDKVEKMTECYGTTYPGSVMQLTKDYERSH